MRDSAPDGSSPRDCALLLAMEDNLKIFVLTLERSGRVINFVINFYRVRDSAPDGSSPRDYVVLFAMEDNLRLCSYQSK